MSPGGKNMAKDLRRWLGQGTVVALAFALTAVAMGVLAVSAKADRAFEPGELPKTRGLDHRTVAQSNGGVFSLDWARDLYKGEGGAAILKGR
jgi:hypothetical protein